MRSVADVSSVDKDGYNSNPVSGLIENKILGQSAVAINITQIVELWVIGNEENDSIEVISHRQYADKALQTGKVDLASGYLKPVIEIFYTPEED